MMQKKVLVKIGVVIGFLFLFFQIFSWFLHLGDGWTRPLTRLVLPAAVAEGDVMGYRRVSEGAHAFVALGITSSYDEAFPLSLRFAVRDARIQAILGTKEQEIVWQDYSVLSDVQHQALLAADLSEKEIDQWIVKPLVRARVAQEQVRIQTELNGSPTAMRLDAIQQKLELGMPFADVARYFSEDSSAVDGGDLGVFLVKDLPVWLVSAKDLAIGESVFYLEGSDAFWIIRLTDKGGADDEAWVQLRGIAVNKPTLGEIISARAQEYPAWVFVW